jgi:FKBP-type peptidyl-prolyl cis-trans isomerase
MKRRLSIAGTALVLAAGLSIATTGHAQDPGNTPDEKAFYAIGVSMGAQLERVKPISDREMNLVIQGIRDRVAGKQPASNPKETSDRVQRLLQERQGAALEREKSAAKEFLAIEGQKKGAKTTESGLIYTEIVAGEGESPRATDKVRVHYHGTLRDGTVFDSSVSRGTPAEFPLNRVIACWTEGVAKMKTGGKSRLVCPSDIAYGDKPAGGGQIPPGAALVFEVELIEILR